MVGSRDRADYMIMGLKLEERESNMWDMSFWQTVTGRERWGTVVDVTGVGNLEVGRALLALAGTEVEVLIEGEAIIGVQTLQEGRARVEAFEPRKDTNYPIKLRADGMVVALGLLKRPVRRGKRENII